MDNNMEYTSVNGTFTYTITNNSSYVFEPVDYVIIKSAFDRWDNIMTLDARLGPGYTITVSYTVDVLEAGMLGGASIQTIVYIGSQTYGNVFPLTADLTMNSSYLYGMKNDVRSDGKTSYYYVLLHEIGHILGIGSLWGYAGTPKVNYIDNGITKSYYTGANALREYKSYFSDMGSSSFIGIPIEDNGGGGTAGVHPEEGPEGGVSANNRYINGIFHPGLDTELMSGWLDSSPVSTPLSRVTLGFLEDMGYIVNYNLADVYRMSWPATTDANNLDKAYIQGFLDVSGSTTIRGTTNINGRVFVYDDVSINGFLRAKYPNESIPPSAIQGGVGSNTFAGDVFMDSKMTVTGDVSMNSKLSIGGDVSMNAKLTVLGDVSMGTKLLVNGITISRGGGNMETNTALGALALNANTTGQYNSAFGSDTLAKNTSGGSNTAFGQLALANNTTGSWNSTIGVTSLNSNTTGIFNSAVGYESGKTNTTGGCNTFLGFRADSTGVDLSYSTAIGANAKITASNQIVLGTVNETVLVLGKTALRGDISMGLTGSRIDICGNLYAQYPLNSIPQSAIIGGVGSNNFTADVSMNQKLSIGGDVSMNSKMYVAGAATLATTLNVNGITIGRGGSNVASNSAFGSQSLNNNGSGATNNSAFGNLAQLNTTTGSNNSAFGAASLQANNVGFSNSAFGNSALQENIGGNNNTAFGQGAGKNNTAGSNNTAIGQNAGNTNTGSNNTFLGYNTSNNPITVSTSTAIGSGAVITASNQIVLGTAGETVLVLGKTALRGDISMGLTGSRIDICGNLYAQYPLNSIPQSAIIGGVGSNNFTADVSMNQKLSVGGDVSMNSKLYVKGQTILDGATSSTDDISVYGVTIGRGAGRRKNLLFGTNPSTNVNLGDENILIGDSVLLNSITSNQIIAIGNNAGTNQMIGERNIFLGYSTGGDGSIRNNSTAIGAYAQITASNQIVLGTAGETVLVLGKTALRGDISMGLTGTRVDICGNLYAQYPNNSIPQAAIIGGVGSNIFTADVSMNQKLIVGGDVSMNTKLSVVGDVSMNQKLSVGGAVTVGSLYSNGAVTSSTLYANGAITTASSVYATGEIRTPSSLYAGGLTAAGASTMGSIYTTGAVSINTALMVGNDASMNAKLSIGGDVSMNSRLYISGPIRQW